MRKGGHLGWWRGLLGHEDGLGQEGTATQRDERSPLNIVLVSLQAVTACGRGRVSGAQPERELGLESELFRGQGPRRPAEVGWL